MSPIPRVVSSPIWRHHAAIAVVLASITTGVAWHWSTRAASGADSYGYVNAAESWARGELRIEQAFVTRVPWPFAEYTFTPLGYRPTPDRRHIVSMYSPGLPLMMAAAIVLAGHCAAFAVVPLMTGLLVLATYAIGRTIERPLVGLAAAWMVATSPVVLYMAMWPMSDVPAAALWATATACLLAGTNRAAAASGLVAASAVLVRPNLVPILGLMIAWLAWRDLAAAGWRDWRRGRLVWFAAGASAGVAAVMIVYASTYGSPFRSGYGSLSGRFAVRWIPRNFRLYAGWLVSTQTPLAVAGLLSLAFPFAPIWTNRRARDASWLLAGCVAIVWSSYLAYTTFYQWWFLRFLLPAWPMMAIGTASVVAAGCRMRSAWGWAIGLAALVIVGGYGIATAVERDVFSLAAQEAEYLEAAKAVEVYAGPDDVIVSRQFSGSTRFYTGRLTLDVSYLQQEPEWLDRAVEWLNARGHHCYFLVNRDEFMAFRREWTPRSRLARLDWAPLMVVRGGDLQLFDSVPRVATAVPPSVPPAAAGHCRPPKPNPTLREITGREPRLY